MQWKGAVRQPSRLKHLQKNKWYGNVKSPKSAHNSFGEWMTVISLRPLSPENITPAGNYHLLESSPHDEDGCLLRAG